MKKPRTNYPWNPKLTGEQLSARIRETDAFIASLLEKHGLTAADLYSGRCTERPR